MSAELDSLDRGLVDVGLTVAEAMARVEVLEARLAEVFRLMAEQTEAWETWARVTRPRPPARRARVPERHLKAIR